MRTEHVEDIAKKTMPLHKQDEAGAAASQIQNKPQNTQNRLLVPVNMSAIAWRKQ